MASRNPQAAPTLFSDERFHGFVRRGAGVDQLARLDPSYVKLPVEHEPPIARLPQDDEPWFGGLLPLVCYSRLTRTQESCLFVFWATEHALIGIDNIAEFEPNEARFSLTDAIHAPRRGQPRRPRTLITTELVALMLRSPGESAFEGGIDAVIEIHIGRVDEAAVRVRAQLIGQTSWVS